LPHLVFLNPVSANKIPTVTPLLVGWGGIKCMEDGYEKLRELGVSNTSHIPRERSSMTPQFLGFSCIYA